jgi:uncharacterized protein (DUF1778 family)
MDTTLTFRVTDEQKSLIESFAAMRGHSVGETVRSAILEQIEDWEDSLELEQAIRDAGNSPTFYTLDEVMAKHGI